MPASAVPCYAIATRCPMLAYAVSDTVVRTSVLRHCYTLSDTDLPPITLQPLSCTDLLPCYAASTLYAVPSSDIRYAAPR